MAAEARSDEQVDLNIPDELPVLPLGGGLVLFPLAIVPLMIDQPRTARLIDDVMRGDSMLVFAAQREDSQDEAGPDDVYRVGTVGIIHQLGRAPDGTIRLVVQGVERVRLRDFTSTDPYLVARIERAPDQVATGVE